jgi:hypothetical protein
MREVLPYGARLLLQGNTSTAGLPELMPDATMRPLVDGGRIGRRVGGQMTGGVSWLADSGSARRSLTSSIHHLSM